MRLLADENVPLKAVQLLKEKAMSAGAGHFAVVEPGRIRMRML